MRYSIYGLCLDANVAIPGLVPCEDDRSADVRVRFRSTASAAAPCTCQESTWYRSLSRDDRTGEPILTIFKSIAGTFRFGYVDGVEFVIDPSGTEVLATRPPDVTEEEVALCLTGPVLGFLLRLRGVVALHASAVVVRDRAVVFVGTAGAGKSTTAAALVRLGYPMVTEDVAALCKDDRTFAVQPGYPSIGLWPDSTSMLFGSPDALPRFTAAWDKRCLDLMATGGFAARAFPLSAIYVLSAPVMPQGPRVARLPAGNAMIELLGNIYGNALLHRELRVQELDTIRDLAAAVPVKLAMMHPDPATLPVLVEAILDDLGRSTSAGAGTDAMRATPPA